ncbi:MULTISPECIES: LamG domain-containing protein [Salinibaculum]|uniref:LamG domain-containing protein n=1 Tax=Salinibaculum TaxID=2732368 RepID=UPI0030CAA60E
MTKESYDLSRRKVLAGLGAIGVAGAGAGLGTSAYFSDQETFTNNKLVAGSLDMKVAATEYYSDWSADEAALAGMAADPASTDIRLPAPEGLDGAQDIALDLNDVDDENPDIYEQFVTAISTNEEGDSYSRVNGGISAASGGLCGTDSDADGPVIIDIGDVKPGDFGGAQFAFELCDNPGYVWLQGALRGASENGVTEPEGEDQDEMDGVVELLDAIQVAYGVGDIQNSTVFEETDDDNDGFEPTMQMSLREFLTLAGNVEGIPLAGDIAAEEGGGSGRACFGGSPKDGSNVHQVSVIWWLPIDHGNEVQTDSVTFDLGFYTEQCRHNDGVGLSTDLVGYWPLDTVWDGTAEDLSGSGNDGTIIGDISSVSGQVANAGSFDGDGDYIEIGPGPSVGNAFTLATWLQGSGFSHTQYPLAVSKWQAGQNRDYLIGYNGPEGKLYAQFNEEPTGNKNTMFGPAPTTGTWYHCVLTYDGTSGTGKFYVNGSEVDSSSGPFNETSSNLVIGSKDGGGNVWDGLIDDVRVYARALSDAEVTKLYNETS